MLPLLIGFLLGWIGSIPVAGPISALVVTRGLQGRFRAGAFISLGAGLAEAAYAFLAFWGFSRYLTQYPLIDPISRGVAAVVLLGLGFYFSRMPWLEEDSEVPVRDSARASFLLGAGLAALNPTLIATWSTAVTTLYSTDWIDFNSGQALPFAAGVCLGISGWFCTLLALLYKYRQRFSRRLLNRAVQWVGYIMMALGLWLALRFILYFVA